MHRLPPRDSPQVAQTEISELKPQIPEWTLVEKEGIRSLERYLRFTDFAEALNFTNRVGALAEEEGHHPAILTGSGSGDNNSLDAQDSRSPPQ